jgi:VWFA-related protein
MQVRVGVAVFAIAFETGVLAQAPAPPAQQTKAQTFSAGATAVLVDVVVRDKHGRPMLDLTKDDFDLFEDGARQTIGSFSVVEQAGGIGIKVGRRVSAPAATSGTGPRSSPADPVVPAERPTVAILFDALKPDALELAQKAALAYLPMNGDVDARVGVFASDPGLRVLQPYTDNVSLARRAVYSLTAAPSSKQEMDAERKQVLNQRLERLDAMGLGRDTMTFSPEQASNMTAAQLLIEQQMTRLEMSMLRTFDSLDRDERGLGTMSALFTIIQSLAVLPGRKTIVYLSEGLPASPSLQARLDSLVSAANRGNVSVYTIDAAGLRAQSALSETRNEIDMTAQERVRQTAVSRDPTDGPMSRMVERTEDLLRLDPQTGLSRLAEDTGGFLIRDTNNLGSAFKRIDEDNRFHYLLTYSPSNSDFDGKFRTIQVKVRRDGAQVFARKGYLAVRRPAGGTLSYEAAALAILDHGKPPNDFPMSAKGFVFPDQKGASTVPIVAHVKTRDLQFHVDESRGTYTAEAVIVARIRNAGGQTLQTLSQQYLLTGAAKDVDVARQGEILFYRQPELQPGVYGLEVIVHDALADKASARLSTVSVPPSSASHIPTSTLVLVQRVEHVAASDRRQDLPFYYGDMLLYPNPGDPLRQGRDTELMFYFSFFKRGGESPAVTLEILQSGRAVAGIPIELPKPVPDGRVQHVGKLPIDKFPAGTYELRLRLRSAGAEETRNAFFTIAQ